MRRKTSKEILAESFRELASERPIDKITIKDIITMICETEASTPLLIPALGATLAGSV